GVFGVITDNVYNSTKTSLNNYRQFEIEGSEVSSHSATHITLNAVLNDAVKHHELKQSAERLRMLGFSANGFIAPYSNIHASNLPLAKSIYDYILIGGTGLNGKNDYKNKVLSRISQFSSGVARSKEL